MPPATPFRIISQEELVSPIQHSSSTDLTLGRLSWKDESVKMSRSHFQFSWSESAGMSVDVLATPSVCFHFLKTDSRSIVRCYLIANAGRWNMTVLNKNGAFVSQVFVHADEPVPMVRVTLRLNATMMVNRLIIPVSVNFLLCFAESRVGHCDMHISRHTSVLFLPGSSTVTPLISATVRPVRILSC